LRRRIIAIFDHAVPALVHGNSSSRPASAGAHHGNYEPGTVASGDPATPVIDPLRVEPMLGREYADRPAGTLERSEHFARMALRPARNGRERNVVPHVAQHQHARRRSAIDRRTTRHPGYGISQRIRKRVEEIFGWAKTIGSFRRTRFRGTARTQHRARRCRTSLRRTNVGL
jgi:hypothetical protein